MFEKRSNNRGQVTIFVIIAVIIVAAAVIFFIARGTFVTTVVPANLEPVYNNFLTCLEDDTLVGVSILESQGGYIELPEFEAGSGYMPFSSQLNFLGNPIPYWYYVSGNGIEKEQVPTQKAMEEQLGEFIDEEIRDCLFEDFYEQGFDIVLGEPETSVNINEENIVVNLDMDLSLERAEDSVLVRNHEILVPTKLGKLHSSAIEIYEYEQENLFLEEYGVDTLRNYAPVDGVELECSPVVWNAEEIFDELEIGLEENTASLKVSGGDFELTQEENKYFVIDVPVQEDVRFLNSRNWPHVFEVEPADNAVLIAEPVGTQPGLGALGFCYIPYHFVYNVRYPVLTQIFEGEEIFQFPMAVVIQGNNPREALETSAFDIPDSGMCDFKTTPITVNTFDSNLNPVNAEISFKCFGEVCSIGNTQGGSLQEDFPECVNGFIVAEAEGFQTNNHYVESTAQSGSADIILERLYEKNVVLRLDGTEYTEDAIITFSSDATSATIVYPTQSTVELAQGEYEIQVYIYSDAEIELEETTHETCTEVPLGGIGGFLGLTQEECVDVTIPAQTVSNALAGGGTETKFIVESQLQGTTTIDINAESLPTPENIEELQNNYLIFENKGLDVLLI